MSVYRIDCFVSLQQLIIIGTNTHGVHYLDPALNASVLAEADFPNQVFLPEVTKLLSQRGSNVDGDECPPVSSPYHQIFSEGEPFSALSLPTLGVLFNISPHHVLFVVVTAPTSLTITPFFKKERKAGLSWTVDSLP